MKKIFLSAILSVITLFAMATKPHVDHVRVNTEKSTIKWKGSKIAESHEGIINIQKGVLMIEHGTLVGGQFSIDMNSITNTDIESEEYRAKLEGHLKSKDFFDVEQFPTATITITNAVKGEGNSYKVVADLTIKGITHPISFDAEVNVNGLNFLATAKIKIDRTKWDITYNSGNFFENLGDYLIKDKIEFDISLLSAR
ncbi:MAG: YceI family protein [Flavobacteriales bacterium]|nr:YceI family protein [Flavobacteriales bacterium]